MSWSYSGDPRQSALDEVRFLIGDTDQSDQLLRDEEILYLLEHCGQRTLVAAYKAAEGLSSQFTRGVESKSVGDLRIDYGERAEKFRQLAHSLKRKALLLMATPYAGGISIADKRRRELDQDRVPPAVARGMDDHPGAEYGARSSVTEEKRGR